MFWFVGMLLFHVKPGEAHIDILGVSAVTLMNVGVSDNNKH